MAIHPPKKPINWVAVRAEYEAGGISLQQLADRLGVSKRTLERRCSRESWVLGVGKVSAKCRQEITDKIVAQKVENTLTMLDMAKLGMRDFYDEWQEMEFKSKEGAVASFEKLAKITLMYSDEHIRKWLNDRGWMAVPIPEFTTSVEGNESQDFEDVIDREPREPSNN